MAWSAQHSLLGTEAMTDTPADPNAAEARDTEPKVRRVILHICEPCIKAQGQECHTPGCIMFLHRVDIPFTEELMEDADAEIAAAKSAGRAEASAWRQEAKAALEPTITYQFRRHRADSLAAHIMQIVSKYLRDEGREHRDCVRDLLAVFYENGVEVITDADRAIAGLPPRNEQGLTVQELQLLEMHRLQVMMRPLEHFLPLPPPPEGGER